eukprot:7260198-Lingulodinium_polyedra.AAC.1
MCSYSGGGAQCPEGRGSELLLDGGPAPSAPQRGRAPSAEFRATGAGRQGCAAKSVAATAAPRPARLCGAGRG